MQLAVRFANCALRNGSGFKNKEKISSWVTTVLKNCLRSVPWRHTTNIEVRVSSAENLKFSTVSSA